MEYKMQHKMTEGLIDYLEIALKRNLIEELPRKFPGIYDEAFYNPITLAGLTKYLNYEVAVTMKLGQQVSPPDRDTRVQMSGGAPSVNNNPYLVSWILKSFRTAYLGAPLPEEGLSLYAVKSAASLEMHSTVNLPEEGLSLNAIKVTQLNYNIDLHVRGEWYPRHYAFLIEDMTVTLRLRND